jgi:hypothetical protein
MYCDMIIASDKAKFGQPEIALGTIPGMGGTQRLTRAVGKSKVCRTKRRLLKLQAMEWILTGDHFDAHTAERVGLVSRVVPHEQLMAEAEKTANKIAAKSRPITLLAKECVNKAYEGTLEEGVVFERRVFHSTFATVCIELASILTLVRKIRLKECLPLSRRDHPTGKMSKIKVHGLVSVQLRFLNVSYGIIFRPVNTKNNQWNPKVCTWCLYRLSVFQPYHRVTIAPSRRNL